MSWLIPIENGENIKIYVPLYRKSKIPLRFNGYREWYKMYLRGGKHAGYEEDVRMEYGFSEAQRQRYMEAQLDTQIAYEREACMASLEVTKTEWKTAIVENRRLELYQKKLEMRQEQREREKALVEELQISDDGGITVVTRNTAVKAVPRLITNMRNLELATYYPSESDEPPCYVLSCSIGDGRKQRVFLDSERIARPSYLFRKFTAAGIYFYVPYPKVMPLLVTLIGKLAEKCEEACFLPDREGWVKWEDGSFEYFGKEDLTWGYVKGQSC